LKIGVKIAERGHAEIFAAFGTLNRFSSDHIAKTDLVVKVFKGGHSLVDLQRLWPPGLAKTAMPNGGFLGGRSAGHGESLCWVVDAQLLEGDRFAFVFHRHWGDLRKLIDKQMRRCNGALPFSFLATLSTLIEIAVGMASLHKLGILHRDLKAANVLVAREGFGEYSRNGGPRVIVADFESSVGTVGTGFWRAPEVLLALKNCSLTPETFTQQTDVYSYAMTCYEVMTGCEPFEGRSWNDYDAVLDGERPALPADDTSSMLLDLVRQCWHEDPCQRPLFPAIVQTLRDLESSARAQDYPRQVFSDEEDDLHRYPLRWVFSGEEDNLHRYPPKNLREFLDHRILENNERNKEVIIFSFARMLSIMLQIALSMRRMHRQGTLHTGLKSSHFKLTYALTCMNSGVWDCISIDISKFDPSAGAVDAGLLEAPEILLARRKRFCFFNAKTFRAQSDVYSYAMICYEVILGQVPFECHRPSLGDRPTLPSWLPPSSQ
jgi:serine/threonine protein kinase